MLHRCGRDPPPASRPIDPGVRVSSAAFPGQAGPLCPLLRWRSVARLSMHGVWTSDQSTADRAGRDLELTVTGLRLYGKRSDAAAVDGQRLRRSGPRCAAQRANGSRRGSRAGATSSRDPTAAPRRVQSPVARRAIVNAAWERAFGFGLFVDNAFAGEININNVVRGAIQCGVVGYWIDQRHAGNRYIAEGVAVICASPSTNCISIGWRSASCRATPTAARSWRCWASARRESPSATWRSTARGKTTCATRSPREEWQARRSELAAIWLVAATRLATRKACAFALRIVVRRFHIFIFQWRFAVLPEPALAFRHRGGATAPRLVLARAPRPVRIQH